MKQPLLGLAALLMVIIISLGIISLFEEATFSTWVAFLFMCCVPAQIVFALVWHCSIPAAASRMAQPARGITLTVLTALIGVVAAVLTYHLVGKGHGITPMPADVHHTDRRGDVLVRCFVALLACYAVQQ